MTIRDAIQIAALLINLSIALAGLFIQHRKGFRYSGYYWAMYGTIGVLFYAIIYFYGEIAHTLSPIRAVVQGVVIAVWLWSHVIYDIIQGKKDE